MYIEFDLYKVFCEVVKYKSISKAADSMFVSQSAITQSIKKLEHLLGGKLFFRNKYGVELTDEGKGYLEICNSKADYIKEVIDDFFELSVLESDNEEVILDRIDMTEAVVQFVMEHEAVINDRKLTPDILIPEKSLFVNLR